MEPTTAGPERETFDYTPEEHAAASTGDYVFHQLIPYIGNKRKLLGLIGEALARTGGTREGTFLDLFAGSGVVSRMAKRLGYRVLANDWEPYALELNRCAVECSTPPPFTALGGYQAAIQTLNTLPPAEGWVTRHLCPRDDRACDPRVERMFYTRANGMRLDAMREQVAQWERDGLLDPAERACLLAPMLYQASYTSNTSGVFKGFHHGWGGQTGTALYRILSRLTLRPALFHENGRENRVYRTDATALARKLREERVEVDVAYLDPPYNQHPYGSNYHVLNTVALWDHPSLSERIEGRNKAGIRLDWRTERRSAYNHRGDAERAYRELLGELEARWILTSYSTDGMIPLPKLLAACLERGRTEVVLRRYKRYRVSTQRYSRKPLNIELVAVIDTRRPHRGPSAEELCTQIRREEAAALSEHAGSPNVEESERVKRG
ncbi:MAG: DNA adenine methylase [Armatimonadota bacterium]